MPIIALGEVTGLKEVIYVEVQIYKATFCLANHLFSSNPHQGT